MNLKAEILAGESYSLEFKLALNEGRIKCLEMAVAFANGMGWMWIAMKKIEMIAERLEKIVARHER